MFVLRGLAIGAVAAAAALALAACAPAQTGSGSVPATPIPARDSFELSGRLSAKYESHALAANFHWTREAGRDELDLESPLGQTIARLSGDATGVRLERADGRVETADDWTGLTTRALGVPLPVEGLAFWIQGVPRQGSAARIEPGSDGNPAVLRQDGWVIVYQAFTHDAKGVPRPQRLTLDYPEVELRIAVDSWR